MNTTLNRLIVHADLEHVTIIADLELFGHRFQRRDTMDFVICKDKFDTEVCGWLEVGEHCALHAKEPMINGIYGLQSNGVVIPLDDRENCLSPGLYALKVDQEKSGE